MKYTRRETWAGDVWMDIRAKVNGRQQKSGGAGPYLAPPRGSLRLLLFAGTVAALVAGGAVAAAALALPAAVFGDPDDGKGEQGDQDDQGDDTA